MPDLIALEIAAGDRPTPGFVHNDFRALDDIEIVCDAREELLARVGIGGVSQIRATHILEHFPYNETVDVLKTWREMLADNGTIYIEVPNLQWQVNAFHDLEISAEDFVYYCFGEQSYDGNFHMAGFNIELLSNALTNAGFTRISITDIGQVLVATAIK